MSTVGSVLLRFGDCEPIAAADPSELRRLFGSRVAALMGLVSDRREVFPRPRGNALTAAEATAQRHGSHGLQGRVLALRRRALAAPTLAESSA